MHDLGFRPFDADNHYYEAEDAFTRYIDPSMAKRCMQWADVDGKKRLLVGGKINKFIPNPTFDPIAKPGSLETYFRGRNEGGMDLKTMFGELDADRRAPRLPQPRRPGRAARRAGHGRRPAVPHPRRRHAGGAQARRPRPARRLQGVQRVARRRLGLRPRRRPALRRADDHAGRPRARPPPRCDGSSRPAPASS